MEVEKLGEVNIDGRVVNLDDISIASCKDELETIQNKKNEVLNEINNLLSKI